ncbi:hypothetical protein [Cellulomonas sp.]|uniref:hypothetical protein n=1 Tax=Cellulomonas sp. TaxID=40001 RepID=UPI002582C3C0|nr:hypothetical protein [Cellulomonas sp.]MCR6687997.1 SurA N-terminal domain-containing protein [Cellulomonas sp.]
MHTTARPAGTGTTTSGAARRRAYALAGAGLTAAALAGCAGTPGAAAVADGRVIPASDVRVAMQELGALGGQISVASVTSVLVQEPIVAELGEQYGVGASDEEAAALLDQSATQADPGAAPGTYSEPTLAIARYTLVTGELSELENADEVIAAFTERLDALDLEVNPRYGTADGGNVGAPAAWPWIITPVEAGS